MKYFLFRDEKPYYTLQCKDCAWRKDHCRRNFNKNFQNAFFKTSILLACEVPHLLYCLFHNIHSKKTKAFLHRICVKSSYYNFKKLFCTKRLCTIFSTAYFIQLPIIFSFESSVLSRTKETSSSNFTKTLIYLNFIARGIVNHP